MNKTSVIILSSLLIFFLIALTCSLVYTKVTPDKDKVTDKYLKAGYECANLNLGNYSIYTYKKGDASVLIIWYSNAEAAEKGIVKANNLKNEKFAVKRGNAVAMGFEKDIRIFQFA